MTATATQQAGIRKTVIHLVLIMATVLGLFFWKLNREAVVKPAEPPAGLVLLESPRALPGFPESDNWQLALMDRADCAPNQCHPARLILERLWAGNTKLPRDLVDLRWFAPAAGQTEVFAVETVAQDWRGLDEAGWFVEDNWERYSHSLLIVNPDNELVAWVRPPFNASQIVRSMALSGIL